MKKLKILLVLTIAVSLNGCIENDISGVYSYQEMEYTLQCTSNEYLMTDDLLQASMLVRMTSPTSISVDVLTDTNYFASSFNYADAKEPLIDVSNVQNVDNVIHADMVRSQFNFELLESYGSTMTLIIVPASELLQPAQSDDIANIATGSFGISPEDVAVLQSEGANGYWLGSVSVYYWDMSTSENCTATTVFTGIRTVNPWTP